MAYFRNNEMTETRRNAPVEAGKNSLAESEEYLESDYDDGFEDLTDDENEKLSEKERKDIQKKRFSAASGAGNLTAIIAGAVVILMLLAFLMNMIGFVLNDVDRNFALFQNRF